MSERIVFHNDGVDYLLRDKRFIRQVLGEIAASAGRTIGYLNIVFCSNSRILRINRQYLGHDYTTDIITFEGSPTGSIESDIFIGLEVVRANALRFNTGMPCELHRVMIHGMLHMCGYDDDTPEAQTRMRSGEDQWLDRLAQLMALSEKTSR